MAQSEERAGAVNFVKLFSPFRADSSVPLPTKRRGILWYSFYGKYFSKYRMSSNHFDSVASITSLKCKAASRAKRKEIESHS